MRPVISISLVLMQLAQGMALPHAHADTGAPEPPEHARLPHFHIGGDHHHHHHHHGHSHSHPHQDEVNGEECLPQAFASELPPADHDSDAVYLDEGLAVPVPLRSKVDLDHQPLNLDQPVAAVVGSPNLTQPRALSPPWVGRFACPIFLQTLALLI